MFGCIKYYKVPKNYNDERLLSEKFPYKLNFILTREDLIKIDASAYYVQIFEGRPYHNQDKKNPKVLFFQNHGYY